MQLSKLPIEYINLNTNEFISAKIDKAKYCKHCTKLALFVILDFYHTLHVFELKVDIQAEGAMKLRRHSKIKNLNKKIK